MPAVFRQVAGAVGLDAFGQRRFDRAQFVPRVGVNKFGQAAGVGESQRADVLLHQFRENVGGFAVGAAAGGLAVVNQRRVPEDKVLAAVGRAVIIHHLEGQAGQFLREFAGIGDGRRTEDKLRRCAVKLAESAQPSQNPGHVRAENPAVDMCFVNHHVFQRAQEPRPLLVVGQNADVQHVRVGQDNPGVFADIAPFRRRRIAVEGGKVGILK